MGVCMCIVQRATDIHSALIGCIYHRILAPAANATNTEVAISRILWNITLDGDSTLIYRILDYIVILGCR